MWKARNFGDQELFFKAKNIETPSCKKVQELQGAQRRYVIEQNFVVDRCILYLHMCSYYWMK